MEDISLCTCMLEIKKDFLDKFVKLKDYENGNNSK